MVKPLVVTILPLLFLIVLFGGGALLRRRNIDMDGEPPINKRLFVFSKYLIPVLWATMVLKSWGVNLSFVMVPVLAKYISLGLWFFGFGLLFIGRLGLGNSFRIGESKGKHKAQDRWIIWIKPEPYVCWCLFHSSCRSPLHAQSDIARGCGVCDCRASQDCAFRRGISRVCIWQRIRRLSQSCEAIFIKDRRRDDTETTSPPSVPSSNAGSLAYIITSRSPLNSCFPSCLTSRLHSLPPAA